MSVFSGKVTALTSYEGLLAGGDKQLEILLQRKNANFDKLTADILKEGLQQKLSAIHYDAMNNYLLYAPIMSITLLSAVLSIFATSTVVKNTETQVLMGICVAILQLVLSLFQSLQKQLNLGGKAGFHSSASTALKNLHETAQHNLAESRYQAIRKAFKTGQLKMGDYDGDDSDADEPKENKAKGDDKESQSESEPTAEENHEERKDKEASASLAKQYKQAVEQVDSLVPINIEAAFSMLESRITVINQSLMYDKSNSLVAWEKVLPALYIQLAETILEYRFWPIFIPPPQDSVEKALKDFKDAIDVENEEKGNSADLLMTIIKRSEQILKAKHDITRKRETMQRDLSIQLSQDMKQSFVKQTIPEGVEQV